MPLSGFLRPTEDIAIGKVKAALCALCRVGH